MIKQKLLTFSALVLFISACVGIVQPTLVSAAANPPCDSNRFLTLPPWYRGLTTGMDCAVDVNSIQGGQTQSDKLRIFIQILAINIVEIMMHVVAYVCIAFIIIGGFKYITSTGSPDGNVKGRQTIQNALIGLVISIASIGIVNFITQGLI